MEKNTEKSLRAFIRKQIAEANSLSENDLMGDAWSKMKPRFLETVNSLIQNIDDDNYDDADDLIGQSIAMLKMWKHRLRSGGMVKKPVYNETLGEEKLNESNFDFVSQFKLGNSFLATLGLNEKQIEDLQVVTNLMVSDKSFISKVYPNGYSYTTIINDIKKCVDSIPSVLGIMPVKLANALKSKIENLYHKKKTVFNEVKTLDGSNEGFKISDNSILEDGLPNFFQQKSFKDTGIYIYSSHYKRVFKTAGNLNKHDVPGDDNIPTILVDANGESYDFKSLKAENCFKVIELPSGFNYKTYSSQF